MRILVTGAAGFIGMHFAEKALKQKNHVLGIDNFNDYYDPNLKRARADRLLQHQNFELSDIDITDTASLAGAFSRFKPDVVVNLAAQAGVRFSIENPETYIHNNIVGFLNVLENCRQHQVSHLVYASSSSVYGLSADLPFGEASNTDHPVSLYGATKKSNELMAHSYSHLFGLPTTGLRFFTVYGPWGRPDMALFKFTKAIISGEPIDVYNNGKLSRDFTFIDDIVEGVWLVSKKIPCALETFDSAKPETGVSSAPSRIFNIGNGKPVIEKCLNKDAKLNFMDMQPGDVMSTFSDTNGLKEWAGFESRTDVEQGVKKFVEWYKAFYASS